MTGDGSQRDEGLVAQQGALALSGSYIERVDRPQRGLYSLRIRGSWRGVLVLSVLMPKKTLAWAVVDERPKGDPADAEVRGLRERLEGGRIHRVWQQRGRLGLEVVQGETRWWVEPDATCVRAERALEGVLPEGEELVHTALDQARQYAETLFREHQRALSTSDRERAEQTIRSLRKRLERRINAIDQDVTAVHEAEERARFAALFVATAAKAPKGTRALSATDWSSGAPVQVELALDPAKSPRSQIEAIFSRAKRLRAGVVVAQRRRDEAELALLALDEIEPGLADVTSIDEIETLFSELRKNLPSDVRLSTTHPNARSQKSTERVPYRCYTASNGSTILVGRSARDNDSLTTQHAKGNDLWFHAKGTPGAHVVLRKNSTAVDPQALIDAATLAAHFSDQKHEAVVEVHYCERRYVQKRRGSPAGQVELLRETVLALRLEPQRVERLLATSHGGNS